MRHAIVILLLALLVPSLALAQVPPPEGAPVVVEPAPGASSPAAVAPPVGDEIADGVGAVVDAYKASGILGALAAVVMLLTALVRRLGLLDRLPKRARILVPLALGCVSALLAAVAGGISWPEAALLALLTGPSAVALHQGIARSLLGTESPESAARSALES